MQNFKRQDISSENMSTYKSFFEAYDHSNIGQITKAQLIYIFKLIDSRINQNWLNKVLMAQGKSMTDFINFQLFVQILESLRLFSVQQTDHSLYQTL